MHLNEYQEKAKETAEYPKQGTLWGLLYTILGLSGESGELANKTGKILRGDFEKDTDGYETIFNELQDVLWFVSAVATELNVSLEEVAQHNLAKLASRKERGVIKGSGDDR